MRPRSGDTELDPAATAIRSSKTNWGQSGIPRLAATRASRPPDKSTLTPIPFEMKDQIAARTMLDVAATYDLLAERAARGSNLADEAAQRQ